MRAKYLWPCLLLTLATAAWAAGPSGMHWQPNLELAKTVAAQTNRLVLVHFSTESCGPCMRMEREVFSRPDVAAAVEASFVPVRVNVQHYPNVARDYGVNAWPSDVILTPQGEVIDRRNGGADAVQYVTTLKQIAARARGTPSQQQGYAQATPAPPYASAMTAGPRTGAAMTNRSWPPSAETQYPPPEAAPQSQRPVGIPPVDGVAAASPTYPQQRGTPTQQPDTSSTAISPNMRGVPGANPGPYAAGIGGPPTRPSAQPWQAESARWNGGVSAAGASASPMSPTSQPVSPTDQPVDRQAMGNPEGRTWGSQPYQRNESSALQRSASGQAAPAAEPGPANPPLALDGYCPVSLAEKERWFKGDPRYGVIHRGRTYLFIGPEEANRFFADPDRYAPVLSGIDVVVAVEENRQVPGKREYGAWFEGRVYLFSGEATYHKFDQDPVRYAAAVSQVSGPAARRSDASSSRNPAYPPQFGPSLR